MAKLKSEPITADDLAEYLESAGDFAFEMKILRMLRGLGLHCEHAGHYEDPVTKKSREFDIRAIHASGITMTRLAIECKNIRDNFPILVSRVPRMATEAFHEFIHVRDGIVQRIINMPNPRTYAHRVNGSDLYPVNGKVGKSIVQVGRELTASLTANDAEVYEKWGQALASSQDLVDAIYDDKLVEGDSGLRAVMPIVVVPDHRLWAVDYGEDGDVQAPAHAVDRVSCYINKAYVFKSRFASDDLTISHLDIVTQSGLRKLVLELDDFELIYPHRFMGAVRKQGA